MPNFENGSLISLETECPICAGKDRRVISGVGRDSKPLTTVVCTGCGLVHSHPIPTKQELDRFYTVDYRKAYKSTYEPRLKHTFRYAPGAYQRMAQIAEHASAGQTRFLDIGSGSGEFLYMARKMGFDASGIEPNTGYAEYTQRVLSLPVQNCNYETADLNPDGYDIINLNHVLEHLPDPLASLRFINSLLREDGLFSVAVPNIRNTNHAPSTRFHYAHIYNFNHTTLKAMLLKAGFEIIPAASAATTILARKVSSSFSDTPIEMPENYRALWDDLTGTSAIAHVASKKGIGRFVGKLYRYPKEFLLALSYGSAPRILDQVYARMSKSAPARAGIQSRS
ncbi:bifunctional 2-polyprenyl-6-hydroxyphenol methylase/3-demethylubiquinol 3-O-methyltransferase UbiG [Stappia sp. ES.058]|uniref:class I SAM-dependent methyltransferase n=1 Tax=Stappia sp. ES.058 TaxID=1881061 RepID=UPI0008797142|nr:class I SAM-dependent methyltransferase [Stappia sp. ES.058]SDU49345.1 Methyltransferase domain-containing protein [Stappia sp. ES.058]